MIWDVDEAAELARDRNSSSRISVTYVPPDDRAVDIHRDDIDEILDPILDNPRDDWLSERNRFGGSIS